MWYVVYMNPESGKVEIGQLARPMSLGSATAIAYHFNSMRGVDRRFFAVHEDELVLFGIIR